MGAEENYLDGLLHRMDAPDEQPGNDEQLNIDTPVMEEQQTMTDMQPPEDEPITFEDVSMLTADQMEKLLAETAQIAEEELQPTEDFQGETANELFELLEKADEHALVDEEQIAFLEEYDSLKAGEGLDASEINDMSEEEMTGLMQVIHEGALPKDGEKKKLFGRKKESAEKRKEIKEQKQKEKEEKKRQLQEEKQQKKANKQSKKDNKRKKSGKHKQDKDEDSVKLEPTFEPIHQVSYEDDFEKSIQELLASEEYAEIDLQDLVSESKPEQQGIDLSQLMAEPEPQGVDLSQLMSEPEPQGIDLVQLATEPEDINLGQSTTAPEEIDLGQLVSASDGIDLSQLVTESDGLDLSLLAAQAEESEPLNFTSEHIEMQEKPEETKKLSFWKKLAHFLMDEEEEQEEDASAPASEKKPTGVVSDENQRILDELEGKNSSDKEDDKKGKKGRKGKKGKKSDGDDEAGGEEPKRKREKRKKNQLEAAEVISLEELKPLSKKKIRVVVFFSITVLVVILLLCFLLPGKIQIQGAKKAYYDGNYEMAYQDLYGKKLTGKNQEIFLKAGIMLRMERKLDLYQYYRNQGKELEAIDALMQGVVKYHEMEHDAKALGIPNKVKKKYYRILDLLHAEYNVPETEALFVSSMEDDVEYTKALRNIEKGLVYNAESDTQVREKLPPLDYLDNLDLEEEDLEPEEEGTLLFQIFSR